MIMATKGTAAPTKMMGERFPGTSRRSLLGALAGAPIIAALANIATSAPKTPLSDWSRAYARWKAADEAWDVHTAKFLNPAIDEIDRLAPMPPTWFEHTARSGQVARYYVDTKDPTAWDEAIGIIGRLGREHQAAWWAWRPKYDEAEKAVGLPKIEEEDSSLCAGMVAARTAALTTPAASMSELLEKADFIKECFSDSINEERYDAILADIRHIAGKLEL
jgi:hypothetical protein